MQAETMRFFRKIRTGIDVAPLLSEIASQEHAWVADTSRQTKVAAQRDTQTIFLRVAAKRRDLDLRENQETHATLMCEAFPRAVAFMESVATEFGSTLERAVIVRLKPNSIIDRHIDTGSYYFLRDRFHLVLASANGSVLSSGDEQVRMWPGELWWFDNKQHHWAQNEGDQWRIHYIFDLLSDGLQHLAVNPLPAPALTVTQPEAPQQPELPVDHPSARNVLLEAIRTKAVLRNQERLLLASSGRTYKWMIDMRRVMTDPVSLDAAASVFWSMLGHKYPFQVGGLETAAIPLIAAIQMKSVARGTPVHGFIVRKERKTYGAGQLIEGALNDEPIIVVDDVLNSGKSMEKIRAILEAYDRHIEGVFVAVDYQSTRGTAWREQNDVTVTAPFTLRDFELEVEIREDEPPQRGIFQKAWSFVSPRGNFYHRVPKSFPVTDNKRVYFGSDSGTFWALDAHDGSVAWQYQIRTAGKKNIWSAPALHDGSVFFGAYDGNVYCLEAHSGAEKWRFSEADWVGSSPALAPELGLLFIGLEFGTPGKQGSVVALDLSTGRKVWEHLTVRYTHASPAYCSERRIVACGSNNDELFLFDAETGTVRWRFQTRGDGKKGSIRHAPAFDLVRETVITGCADGYIYVIDVSSGQEVWHVRTDNEVYTIPLCHGNLGFVGSTDKFLYVLDLESRTVKTRHPMYSKIYAPPRLLAGAIYVGACNGVVYKLDADSAEIVGSFQLPDAITNAMAHNSADELFYALTYVNELYALKPVAES
jgi:orotate phosphoribosyltransferase